MKDVTCKRLCLPKIKDLYDVISPVFVVSKILGLAPFRFDNSTRRYIPHCGSFIGIRFGMVIGLMVYVAVLVYDPNSSINIGWLALHFEIYLGTMITGIILILAVANQKLLIPAIESLISIDKAMKQIGINVTYKNAQKFAYSQISFICCIFSSKLILQAFATPKNKFVYNVFNVVDFMNTIMMFQYVDILLLLRQRYIWLNRKIRSLSQASYGQYHCLVVPKQCFAQENVQYIPTKKLIRCIGKLHRDLYRTAKIINRTYGVQILVTISARFVMITTQLINLYKTIQDPNQGSVNTIGENTASKARDTGVYLHTLWDPDDAIKEEVNFMSLQILHQNLHFTAAGFFTLDYTLIHSIVGAVTTYMIIIIQFDVNTKN
ncbi:putative gustatory receptor 28b isoform X2 [Photinus pyralis]|uniref:putative gustatory receptor 28b isoform X2 n=1 Tax=Photinus pyralis TaxID=7054 RepID=UPI0012678240|nr:putative gustatory receptor 28b isoform X2 [Photinus pyralis]